MELSEFTLSLIYLGLPGIVASYFIAKLTGVKAESAIAQVLTVFVLSVTSYSLLVLGDASYRLYSVGTFTSALADVILAKNRNVPLTQLGLAIVASMVLSYVLSYAYRHNVINRIGQRIRATNRYGDEDVWHYFHNVPDEQKNNGWLFVRDLKANLSYHCNIATWSDTGMDRELILSDVSVFTNDTGEYLYKCAHLYLCRNKDDLTIEVPTDNAEKVPEYQWEDPDKREENRRKEK